MPAMAAKQATERAKALVGPKEIEAYDVARRQGKCDGLQRQATDFACSFATLRPTACSDGNGCRRF